MTPDLDLVHEAMETCLLMFIEEGRVPEETQIRWDTIHQEFDEEKQDFIHVVELTDGTEILVHIALKQ